MSLVMLVRTTVISLMLLLLCGACGYQWPECEHESLRPLYITIRCTDRTDTISHSILRSRKDDGMRHCIYVVDSISGKVVDCRTITGTKDEQIAMMVTPGRKYKIHTWSDFNDFDISNAYNIVSPTFDNECRHKGATAYHASETFIADDTTAHLIMTATDPQARLVCIATDATTTRDIARAALNHLGFRPDVFSIFSGCAVDATPGVTLQCKTETSTFDGAEGVIVAGDVLFAPASGSTRIRISLTIERPDGQSGTTPAFEVPVGRGALTIVSAPFLSMLSESNSSDTGGIRIDPSFDGTITIIID